MLISYPLLPVRGEGISDENYEQSILDLEMLNAGVYPSSHEREWHGGIHIQSDCWQPVRAIADGVLVAYRFSSDLLKEREEDADTDGRIDNSFVLLKHETEVDSIGVNGVESAVKVTFYSLYMHLCNKKQIGTSMFQGKPASSFIHAAVTESDTVKIDGNTKIYRKEILGFLGETYANKNVIHFEIFTTDSEFNQFFVNSNNTDEVGVKGTWGDSYFIVKAGTPVFKSHPNANPSSHKIAKCTFPTGTDGTVGDKNLFVRISYRKGAKYTTTWLDEGPDKPPLWLTNDEGEFTGDYEYNIYEFSKELYPSCPSAGYELMRFGKIVGPDKNKLLPAQNKNWQFVTYATDKKGYINLADPSVQILSDADFPYWLGWQKKETGLFSEENGQCDMHDMLTALKVDHDSEDPNIARQHLKEYFQNAEHQHARIWAQKLVCKFPSEWDKANNGRCAKLKEPNGPYADKSDEYDKHMKFVESIQWWSDAGLQDSNVWHFHPFQFISLFKKCGWLSKEELAQCIPRKHKLGTTSWSDAFQRAEKHHVSLNRFFKKFYGPSYQRIVHALAQIYIETGLLGLLEEGNKGVGKSYGAMYGRGYMQLTWADNYQAYGEFKAISNHTGAYKDSRITATSMHRAYDGNQIRWSPRYDPDIVASDLNHSGESSGFFWVTKHFRLTTNINRVSDLPFSLTTVGFTSWLVNGGGNGYPHRQQFAKFLRNFLSDGPSLTGVENFRYPSLSVQMNVAPPNKPPEMASTMCHTFPPTEITYTEQESVNYEPQRP